MISFYDVSFAYKNSGNHKCLKDINLTINDGELVVLCGESGCGKTTLTRMINGLIPYYYPGELSGQILLNGRLVSDYQMYEISKIAGSVFQNPRTQFYNVDTTSEILFGCENMGMPIADMRKRLQKTVQNLGIENLLDKSLFELSGGEKQKIACSSADAIHPEIYVLDEPSSNLDISSINDLSKVIAHWKSQGKTIVIAEHRLYYLIPLADRIVFMKDGFIAREFTGDEFRNLSSETVRGMGLRSCNPFNLPLLQHCTHAHGSLEIKNLTYAYGKKDPKALDVSKVAIPAGEVIAIVGSNGAGKSTFARCLCGLNKKASGILKLGDHSYNTKNRIHHCYMVMQDVNHQLFTDDVLDELLLSMPGDNVKRDEAIARQVLDKLDLADKVGLHPMSLSGGEKQRVAIASAVVSNKEILIFDEPTSGLDYKHMLDVTENILYLKNLGRTIFVITHDPEFINTCCSYVICINSGHIAWQGELDGDTLCKLNELFTGDQL